MNNKTLKLIKGLEANIEKFKTSPDGDKNQIAYRIAMSANKLLAQVEGMRENNVSTPGTFNKN